MPCSESRVGSLSHVKRLSTRTGSPSLHAGSAKCQARRHRQRIGPPLTRRRPFFCLLPTPIFPVSARFYLPRRSVHCGSGYFLRAVAITCRPLAWQPSNSGLQSAHWTRGLSAPSRSLTSEPPHLRRRSLPSQPNGEENPRILSDQSHSFPFSSPAGTTAISGRHRPALDPLNPLSLRDQSHPFSLSSPPRGPQNLHTQSDKCEGSNPFHRLVIATT